MPARNTNGIYFHAPGQKEVGEQLIAVLTAIVTEVTAAQTLCFAGDCQQEHFAYNSKQLCCRYVVAPMLAKFRHKSAARAKNQPDLMNCYSEFII